MNKAGIICIIIYLILLSNISYAIESDTIAAAIKIDSIYVDKSDRVLIVFSKQQKIKSYSIGLGFQPIGKKQFEGDGKTPEGLYFIDTKSAQSKFHKNLNISYPNNNDKAYAKLQQKNAGGDIKIHGLPNGVEDKHYEVNDWTLGCIALRNKEIDELFKHIRIVCPIYIAP
ncbi:MAG TPA: L,D-transpeptidase family protein [Chitinophagales bacterium]|nr:L,D-transpeptidase family protein [Chitinophagales bacterium]